MRVAQVHEWSGKTGEIWAAEWRRTDRSFGALTEQLLGRIHQAGFRQALDIGCGAGELSLALGRAAPAAQILGVDVSPALVAIAQERGANLANVSFAEGDAARWRPAPGFAPDLLVSRHGVMFFADPPAAFANLAALAAPEARLLFSCFRDPADNPFFTEVNRLLPQAEAPRDPHAAGPFAFADPAHVEAILNAGGWQDCRFEPVDFGMVVGGGEDPVEDTVAYYSVIGPAARSLAEMPAAEREELFDSIRALARRNLHEGLVVLRAAAWIVSARKG
ncbi:conserved hypothetical protein [Altererythrobacter sp. B11]|uniref:class I SAM-dependent methyltransferase n=1 Tax=Altererythrobacter sp. B11 TaxID=2060312 RepID=UPI000DC6DEC0|nr:class I SAM-dependent methyltransferase [Altererythrobacter sp. B11]BBC72612.1 conserved hypothetical protein [Altererythrobacter sp. B11]